MDLQNKVAVITGASSGIGKAIAQKLSANGCKTVLASRSVKKLEKIKEGLPAESLISEMDVGNSSSVKEAFIKIKEHFGQIDILVNSAGIMPLTYLKNLKLEEWLKTIEVNLKGTLRCIHQVLPDMKKNKAGHIINIASVDGKEPYPGGAIYSASKAAIITLSRAMRMELSPEFNIRVTSIEPGTVDTDLRENIDDKELLNDKDYGENEPKLSSENIADAVLYALLQPDTVNVNELLIKPTGKA